MADLIDRAALLKEICNSCDGWCEKVDCDCVNCKSDHRCDIVCSISEAPTIDPASLRPKGEWVIDHVTSVDQFEVVKCSNCDYEAFAQAIHVRFGNYCPNCGARMDLKK